MIPQNDPDNLEGENVLGEHFVILQNFFSTLGISEKPKLLNRIIFDDLIRT